ncbi:hypothetical protein [Streptomyces sp. HPF1205]|uniref:hypothetical protein n=1 Tax=Streptomyces sp. HPF1205 TaxID=2873262 RepID=UPI001CECDE92|nr:hypothetical protein [Streptomyces sp. HPF1205]
MLALTMCAYIADQVVQWRYGWAGVLAVGLVTVGHRIRSTAFTAVGLTALALLLAQ